MRCILALFLSASVLTFGSRSIVGAAVTPLPLQLEDEFNYVINLQRRAEVKEGSAHEEEVVQMRDKTGKLYSCTIPAAMTAAEMREKQADERLIRIASSIKNAYSGRAGAPVPTTVSTASDGCIRKQFEYWTYEICPSGRVSQYHVKEGSPRVQQSLGSFASDSLQHQPSGAVTYVQTFSGGTDGRSSRVTFTCDAPGMPLGLQSDVLSVAEASPLHYNIIIGLRDVDACKQLVTPFSLLAPFNGSCITHGTGGWWSYQLCVGGRLTQYHQDNGKMVAELLLGEYEWRAGEKLDTTSVGENAALTQAYIGGTACDIQGGSTRRADVRFECSMDSNAATGLHVVSITEPSTCTYKIVVASQSFCEHPALVSSKAASNALRPTRIISCVPAAADGGVSS